MDHGKLDSRPFHGFEEIDTCSNPDVQHTISEVIEQRLSRRGMLQMLAAGAAVGLGSAAQGGGTDAAEEKEPSPSSLTFEEIAHGWDRDYHVAPGHDLQVLVRWGDRLKQDAPAFHPLQQTPESQLKQFGYNSDFIAFLPLPFGSESSENGLLCVNHEYTDTNLMFPNITTQQALKDLSREQVDVELAAHGHSVVEVRRVGNAWRVVEDSPYNRRLTALDTKMRLSGPAAGLDRMKTKEDSEGLWVTGTLNNCGGGVTPWGTVLLCEENFDGYFSGDPTKTKAAELLKRYGFVGESRFSPAWAKHYARFNIEQEPNEPNRFGWVVEFNPHNPESVPVKRTALGRFKHEGCGLVVNPDGRIVIYSGDDERFDYLYRFVSRDAYTPNDREANRNLLDHGTLSVARFGDDGKVRWLPLTFGEGPLTEKNGFTSQGDVMVETRRAADLLGATPMDRPEDVEVSPVNGRVYVILTNNSKRKPDQVNAANPRASNRHGHILELLPPNEKNTRDHAADEFQWDMLMMCGNPSTDEGVKYHPQTSKNGWLSCPDNSTFDQQGRLWIATDNAQEDTHMADGIYACDVTGPGRALPRLFFSGPRGAEISGVCFTPDNRTLFLSVQHPAEEANSTFSQPSTRWPDFSPGIPPRPSVVAITRRDDRVIGT